MPKNDRKLQSDDFLREVSKLDLVTDELEGDVWFQREWLLQFWSDKVKLNGLEFMKDNSDKVISICNEVSHSIK